MSRSFLGFVLLSAVGLLGGAPAALAQNVECTGVIIGGTFDNVTVPPNETCDLNGATVRANVLVQQNANFFGNSPNVIHGSLTASGASSVFLLSQMIHGNVFIDANNEVSLVFSEVGGNVTVTGVTGDETFPGQVHLHSNTVARNLRITGTEGAVSIHVERNTIERGNIIVTVNEAVSIVVLVNQTLRGSMGITNNVDSQNHGFHSFLDVSTNTIAANLEVSGNKGTGEKSIHNNAVGQGLSCIGNAPPIIVFGNTARLTTGQCRL